MPEGHTIHRVARDHQKWFGGQNLIVISPQGRFENESKRLTGLTLPQVTAHGKHLFYHFGPSRIAHVHLGLYGKFRIHQNPAPEPRGAVRVRMVGSKRTFDLNGPNCCELIDQERFLKIKERLGQDPLRTDANPEKVWKRFERSHSTIGAQLLNQSVIAGVGNVYRAEILFLLGIHPERPVNRISHQEFKEMWKLTVKLLRAGVKYNRIITVDANRFSKPPSRLTANERLNVYKRTSCLKCGGQIRHWKLANRKMYACPQCQKA